MPQPPPEKPAARRAFGNPARAMLDSPLAAAARARVYRGRRKQSAQNGVRVWGIIGSLLVHVICLLTFVLGPAYQVKPPKPSTQEFLRIRLIEPPEPPPPPPVRGTPPKEHGPRHQGTASRPTPNHERSNNQVAAVSAPAKPVVAKPAAKPAPAKPVIAQAARPKVSKPKPTAAPKPPVSLPKPAPTPDLQPIPLAGEPPTIELPTPALQAPVPPKFQPEAVRKPQLEGNRPVQPPPSLAMPEVPPTAAPPITISSIALNTEVPDTPAPASITPARIELPAAPPVPDLQPVPLPAQAAPTVNLQTQISPPSPDIPYEKPQVQAPRLEVAAQEPAELEAVPLSPAPPTSATLPAPELKIQIADQALKPAIQQTIEAPAPIAPPTVAEAEPTVPAQSSSSAPAPTAAELPSVSEATPAASPLPSGKDVSTAPDATPQGSDTATPGQPDGMVEAPPTDVSKPGNLASNPAQGKSQGLAGTERGSGQPGGNQSGADHGEKEGALPGYVQLKPTGDTQIMNHSSGGITYAPTRFNDDWAPDGENAIDAALRHAVEKTQVKHTFHLPRGVRVECAITPLLPIALFGCHNPDPPAKPVAAEVYNRLHMAPANPVAAPAAAASIAGTSEPPPAPMIKYDNSAECAAARLTGGPLPLGCAPTLDLPVKRTQTPASSSSSWVPASDQF